MNGKTILSLAVTACLALGCSEGGMFGSKDKSDTSVKNHQTIATSELPDNVMRSFKADHPSATIEKAARQKFANGATGYRITYTSDGRRETAEYNQQGQRATGM